MSNSMNGTANTSDGCAISYTLHAAPAAGAPRIALIHSLALDRSFWDAVVGEPLLSGQCKNDGSP